MSGGLVGGLVGAAIGIAVPVIGPMWGFAIGSTVGNMLDPPDVARQRLTDLRPQSSEYGRPIPIVYGTIGLQGCVIWATDLIEVEGEDGGKGGGAPTPNAYYANFAVAICEGPVNLGRIWAGPDKRLIWDGANLEGADAGAEMRFYSGTEDQEPDPLIESHMGAGNVPAYRGTAYVVFEHFPVKNDGNRIPFLTIEVGSVESEANEAPEQLGIWWPQAVFAHNGVITVPYQGSYYGIITRNADDYTLVSHYVYPLIDWLPEDRYYVLDAGRNRLLRRGVALEFGMYELSDGEHQRVDIVAPVGADSDLGSQMRGFAYQNGWYVGMAWSASLPARITLYLVNPDTLECEFAYAGDLPDPAASPSKIMASADSSDNHVYLACIGGGLGPSRLYRIPMVSNFTPVDMGAVATTMYECEVDPHTGLVWTCSVTGGNLNVTVHDPATDTQVHAAAYASSLADLDTRPFTFVPEDTVNNIPTRVIITGSVWLAVDTVNILRGDSPFGRARTDLWPGELQIGYAGTAAIDILAYNPVNNELVGYRDGGNYSYAPQADPALLQHGATVEEYTVDHGMLYMGENDRRGDVDPQGISLAEIVEDLSIRAGLAAPQVDVTQLADDLVEGYAITGQTDVRSAIMLLAPAYYFDAVESGTVIKFVKRGGATAMVIPDEDLGAYESGGEVVEPLEVTRQMDEELPDVVTVRYILEATDYDPAAKSARRLVGYSGNEAALDLPIVMSDEKAAEVADVNLHLPWAARLTYRFSLPRKYVRLEPTDIVEVHGVTMCIVTKKETLGRLQFEARHEDVDRYTPHVIVTPTPPSPTGPGQGGVEIPSDVVLELA
jgi:hypothetical protein